MSREHYDSKAFAAIMWTIAFLHGVIAAGGFTIGTFVDPESRSFSILPGFFALACLVGLIIQSREAMRCHRISKTYFPTSIPRINGQLQ